MNERIQRLHDRCLQAKPSVSAERAMLLTDFYRRDIAKDASSPAVLRALSFQHLLVNQTIWIGEDELIVGERGPSPKATSTYPELCCHSLQDLQLLNDRTRTSYSVDDSVLDAYRAEVIPFWDGRSIRDRLFDMASPAWLHAFEAGVFTEFMEQRAPGHAVLDGKIYHSGLLDFIAQIKSSRAR
ncbi:pyruvate formate lyase family protein, partial [Candidatus Bipolaricaulota bacterium]